MVCPALAATLAGCGGARGTGAPAPSPAALAAEVAQATRAARIESPSRLTFAWRAREPGVRGSGLGVARLGPPDRVRLDLFLENGESAAIAAMEGDRLLAPVSAELRAVPRSALLWAVLGAYRPGDGAEVVGGGAVGDLLEIRVRLADGDVIRYRMRGGALTEAALLKEGEVTESVVLLRPEGPSGYPSAATYRNLRDYRELELKLESSEHVDPFPPHIWRPGR